MNHNKHTGRDLLLHEGEIQYLVSAERGVTFLHVLENLCPVPPPPPPKKK